MSSRTYKRTQIWCILALMADDRMYLKCEGCGQTFYLASYSGSIWGVAGYAEQFFADFNEFLDEHSLPCMKFTLDQWEPDTPFSLEYESLPQFPLPGDRPPLRVEVED